MELIVESDTYTPALSNSGVYEDCVPLFGIGITGYYCSCGTRKDKVYTSREMISSHFKSKTHQKWIEVLNLNKTNHFIENRKLNETVASQRLIIAKMDKQLNDKDTTITYLTRQLVAQQVAFVDNLIDIN